MFESLPAHARATGAAISGDTDDGARWPEPGTRIVLRRPPRQKQHSRPVSWLPAGKRTSRSDAFPCGCQRTVAIRSDLMRPGPQSQNASLVTVAGAAPEFVMNDSTGFPFHPGRATSSRAGHLKQRKTPGNPRGVSKYTECEGERVGRRTSKPCSRGGAEMQRKAFRKLENQKKSWTRRARKKPPRLKRLGSRVRCAYPGYNFL